MSLARKATMTTMALLAVALVASPVAANGRPLQAQMTGANEVPGPGDEDGTGAARLRLNSGKHRICYSIEVEDITLPATAAHIHTGAAGVAGPPLVTLGAPDASGVAEGCVTVARSDIKAIRKHPADYYVNVHNGDFPDGAIRGQLGRWAPGKKAH